MNRLVKFFALPLAAVVAPMLVATPASAVNLVANGGFEAGLAGWSCVGETCILASDVGQPPRSGQDAFFGFDNFAGGVLSQVIATDAGETYDLSFFSTPHTSLAPGNILHFQIDGAAPAPVVGQAILDYRETVASFVAAGAATTISFLFETDPGAGGWLIDDVSVEASEAVVSLPAALPLLAAGVGAFGFMGWRRKRAA